MIAVRSDRLRLALTGACLSVGSSTAVLAQPAQLPSTQAVDANQAAQACKAIAAMADHGADALKAADLSRQGQGQLLDLANDGHPKVIHFDTQGTAHGPVLEDEQGKNAWEDGVWNPMPEAVRWANELSVLKAGGRTWVVSWDDGSNVAVLDGATDGHATCEFRTEWLPPRVSLLPGGRLPEMHTYQDLLFGQGHVPPRIKFPDALEPTALFHYQQYSTGTYGVGTDGWRVDLGNSGHPLDLVEMGYGSSAGAGCEFSQFGLVRNGTVVASLLSAPLPLIVPFSSAFDGPERRMAEGVSSFFNDCDKGVYVPVLDDNGHAYVMLDTTDAGKHLTANGVRVLAGATDGKLQPLARLVWSVRNRLTKATGP